MLVAMAHPHGVNSLEQFPVLKIVARKAVGNNVLIIDCRF